MQLRWIKKKTDYGKLMLQQKVDGVWVDTPLVEEGQSQREQKKLRRKIFEKWNVMATKDINAGLFAQVALTHFLEVVDDIWNIELGRFSLDELIQKMKDSV